MMCRILCITVFTFSHSTLEKKFLLQLNYFSTMSQTLLIISNIPQELINCDGILLFFNAYSHRLSVINDCNILNSI